MDQAVTKSKLSAIIRHTKFAGLITLVESDVLVWINCQSLQIKGEKSYMGNLPNCIIPLRAVCRAIEIKFRHTAVGKKLALKSYRLQFTNLLT